MLLDANAALMELAKTLMAGNERLADAGFRIGQVSQLLANAPGADLVVASYLIGELDERGRAELAAALWERTRDTLLVVEPGTPAGYARIIALRAQLIANGAHVLAPCPHDKACPLVAPDWCHFAQRLPRSRDHMLMKDADVPFEDEKFSYVALSRVPAEDARRARACTAACRQGGDRSKALHGQRRHPGHHPPPRQGGLRERAPLALGRYGHNLIRTAGALSSRESRTPASRR